MAWTVGPSATAVAAAFAALLFSSGVAAAEFKVSSIVPDLLTVKLTRLPQGPGPAGSPDLCSVHLTEPTTPGGRYVQQQGWGVVSEAALGDLTLVSFGGEFVPGTSGSCAIEQGNLALFEGDTLRSLVYTNDRTDRLIGSLEQLDNGTVRLWGGDFLATPTADLTRRAAVIEIGPLASEDSVCSGTATVPNVFGIPVTEARETLQSAGWTPVPQTTEGIGQETELRALGVVETESCSGTGFGFCGFAYEREGASLSITTVGELSGTEGPQVVGYGVQCQPTDTAGKR